MSEFSDFIFNIDDWLEQTILLYPVMTYVLIFSIVFTESAFFPAAPFLPGDGLLFAVGVLAAGNIFNLWIAIPVLIIGGITGTRVAFVFGRKTGIILLKKFPYFNQKHYTQAHEFYEKHGSMAFLFSRFMPVVRALVPLVAGVAKMENHRFLKYTVICVSLWVLIIIFIGYKIGHLAFVKYYFGWIILGISAVSFISITLMSVRQQYGKKQ